MFTFELISSMAALAEIWWLLIRVLDKYVFPLISQVQLNSNLSEHNHRLLQSIIGIV